jgi:CheY-like chemotaxis protein
MTLAGTRVMVVEDEAVIAMMIEDLLIDLDCDVVMTAARLEEAREKASNVSIDVALLDVNLAGQLSYPVATVLESRAIPIVFVTGYDVAELPFEWQHVPVLSKPFSVDELARALLITMRSAKPS